MTPDALLELLRRRRRAPCATRSRRSTPRPAARAPTSPGQYALDLSPTRPRSTCSRKLPVRIVSEESGVHERAGATDHGRARSRRRLDELLARHLRTGRRRSARSTPTVALAALVVNQATGERTTAVRGGGAYRDGVPLRASSVDPGRGRGGRALRAIPTRALPWKQFRALGCASLDAVRRRGRRARRLRRLRPEPRAVGLPRRLPRVRRGRRGRARRERRRARDRRSRRAPPADRGRHARARRRAHAGATRMTPRSRRAARRGRPRRARRRRDRARALRRAARRAREGAGRLGDARPTSRARTRCARCSSARPACPCSARRPAASEPTPAGSSTRSTAPSNFLHGLDAVGVSVGLVADGEPVVGVVHAPLLDRTYAAPQGRRRVPRRAPDPRERRGRPSRRSSRPGSRSGARTLLPRYEPAFGAALHRFEDLRRVGAASLDLCWTAEGVFDGYFELRLGPWDVAAGGDDRAGGRRASSPTGTATPARGSRAATSWPGRPQVHAVLARDRLSRAP